MKKRIVGLLLLLLLACVLPAQAEEGVGELIKNAMYRIVLRTDEGDTTLGSAVLFLENNVLLTAEACCVEGDLYAVGEDGEHQILLWEKTKDSGVALMEMIIPSTAEPMNLAAPGTETLPYLFGANQEGKLGSVPLHQARTTVYRSRDAFAFTAGEGLLPGAFAADVNGGIMGLVLAQQAEGEGIYICLDPEGLYDALMDTTNADQFLDVALSWQDGLIHAVWEDEARTGGTYAITVSCEENVYYTTYGETAEKRSSNIIVPPGHDYYVQLQWVEDGQEALEPVWSAMTVLTVPEVPFTDYGFQQECFLTCLEPDQESPRRLTGDTVSAALLMDETRKKYLEIECSYDLEEAVNLPVAIELITPNQQFHSVTLTYLFDPVYEQADRIYFRLDELFTECAQFSGGTLLHGEYTIRYAVSGKVAGEYTFLVGDADDVQTAASSGFITDLEVTETPGSVTISWANAELPKGAKVRVYFLFENNSYYIYQDMAEDATETFFFTVPGRGLVLWATWFEGEATDSLIPQFDRDHYVTIPAVPETPFTANGFTNVHMSVVPSKDATAAERTDLLPVAPITREALADPENHFYFQTHDTYQVSATTEDHPLMIVLETPEGLCFVERSYFIFDVTLQECDQWLRDLSDLFDSYADTMGSEAWPAGEYRILYCIDGQIAGEYAFTLE